MALHEKRINKLEKKIILVFACIYIILYIIYTSKYSF